MRLAEAVFHLVAPDGDPLLAIAVGTKILVMDARSPFHDKVHFVKWREVIACLLKTESTVSLHRISLVATLCSSSLSSAPLWAA